MAYPDEHEINENDLCECHCEAWKHNGEFDKISKDYRCTGCSKCSEFIFSEELNMHNEDDY